MSAEEHLGPQFSKSQLTSRWQCGNCGTYARTLAEMHPGLRLGAIGEKVFEDDDPAVHPSHFFAHDDTHAYDSLGRHSLPYQHPGKYYQGMHQQLDVPDHGVAEEEHDNDEDMYDAMSSAARHIKRYKILGD